MRGLTYHTPNGMFDTGHTVPACKGSRRFGAIAKPELNSQSSDVTLIQKRKPRKLQPGEYSLLSRPGGGGAGGGRTEGRERAGWMGMSRKELARKASALATWAVERWPICSGNSQRFDFPVTAM